MRLVRIGLVALLLLIQWPLWFGDGGWLRAWERERQLAAAKQSVDQLKQRNAGLEAEVHDLRDGTAAIEERARAELCMIRADEVFVQVLPSGETAMPQTTGTTPPTAAASSTPGGHPAPPVTAGPTGTTTPASRGP